MPRMPRRDDHELERALAEHRPALLRHCYRMMGSFAEADDVVQEVMLRAWRARDTFAGDAPLAHWLMRIATNACLTALAQRRRRSLPQLAAGPTRLGEPLVESEPARWISPAPDAQLFANAAEAVEAREQVALAFVALLQRLPPRQRAVVLLKDVLGWRAQEIAAALALSTSAVSSALHRARATLADLATPRADPPPPDLLDEYVRCWEQHDLDALVQLLRRDVVLAMPPHSAWFRGVRAVRGFFESARFEAFWSRGLRLELTAANALPALVFYVQDAPGTYRFHSIQVVRIAGGRVAEACNFIGPAYAAGFQLRS